MQLPEDHRLAYVISHEAWYGQTSNVIDHPQMNVMASSNGGGVAWEFGVEEVELGHPTPAIKLSVFDDAFATFQQIPEFFAAIGEKRPTTLAEIVEILNELGAVDETERVRPARV